MTDVGTGSEIKLMAQQPRNTSDAQLAYISKQAEKADNSPLRVRLMGGLYDYSHIQWLSDRRPSLYLNFKTVRDVVHFQNLLGLFIDKCVAFGIPAVLRALKGLK